MEVPSKLLPRELLFNILNIKHMYSNIYILNIDIFAAFLFEVLNMRMLVYTILREDELWNHVFY